MKDKSRSLTELRVICAVAGEWWEASTPTSSFIGTGYKRLKSLALTLAGFETVLCSFLIICHT